MDSKFDNTPLIFHKSVDSKEDSIKYKAILTEESKRVAERLKTEGYSDPNIKILLMDSKGRNSFAEQLIRLAKNIDNMDNPVTLMRMVNRGAADAPEAIAAKNKAIGLIKDLSKSVKLFNKFLNKTYPTKK
jgi:hypothetical protein